MLQGTMDNDTNLNGVFRHAWSPRSITKVVAQVRIKKKKKAREYRFKLSNLLIFLHSSPICLVTLCFKLNKKLMDQIIQ